LERARALVALLLLLVVDAAAFFLEEDCFLSVLASGTISWDAAISAASSCGAAVMIRVRGVCDVCQ